MVSCSRILITFQKGTSALIITDEDLDDQHHAETTRHRVVDHHADGISDVEERAGSSTCVARSSSGAESSGTSDTNTGHHTFQRQRGGDTANKNSSGRDEKGRSAHWAAQTDTRTCDAPAGDRIRPRA